MNDMIKILVGIGVLLLIGLLVSWKKKTKEKRTIQEIEKEYHWNTEKENFKTDFLKVLKDKSDLKYLVIDFSSYYVQFMKLPESQEFYGECVSNEFLSEKERLNQNQIDEILKRNYRKPNEKDSNGNSSPNYSKIYKAEKELDFDKIYNELIHLMIKVYKMENNELVKVRYD